MNESKSKKIPQHVAIIMDGNGRWAKKHGLDRVYGHINGVESVRKVIKAAISAGIKYITLYAFSTENWGRPENEVNALMELLCDSTAKEVPELKKQGIKLHFIGDIEKMSDKVKQSIINAEKETSCGEKMVLTLAVNYSGRWEIKEMVKHISTMVKNDKIEIKHIDDALIGKYMTTASMPDPDMLIRTSGEIRLSNFLLWQLAYSELYFTDVLWPDFDENEFNKALEEYAKRDRRYGLLTE